MGPNDHKPRRSSSSTMRRSLYLLGLQCCSHSSSAFLSLPIPNKLHSVRTWATHTTSYANELNASSSPSESSPGNELKYPARVIGYRRRPASTLLAAKARAAKTFRRNTDTNRREAGAWYQRDEMLQHDILSKEEEAELGNKIVLAKKLREVMYTILEQAKTEAEERHFEASLLWEDADASSDWASDEEELGLGMNGDESELTPMRANTSYQNDDSMEAWQDSLENYDFAGDQRIASTLVRDGSKLSISGFDADLILLSDDDVQTRMNIKGGKEELRTILFLGSEARTTLMRNNLRLVVSISKKWMGRSFAAGNGDGARTINLYSGGWDRPSLDEVIQEGVLGLARAADKYDPSRGLRFSTYSTHWITSYVRQCFQNASTGCLQVPAQLHEIKVRKSSLRSIIDLFIYVLFHTNQVCILSHSIECLQISSEKICRVIGISTFRGSPCCRNRRNTESSTNFDSCNGVPCFNRRTSVQWW